MTVKARMDPRDFLNGLNYWEAEKICSLKDNPDFYKFLPEPCFDEVVNRQFKDECVKMGVPVTLVDSPQDIHSLVFAILRYANGNA